MAQGGVNDIWIISARLVDPTGQGNRETTTIRSQPTCIAAADLDQCPAGVQLGVHVALVRPHGRDHFHQRTRSDHAQTGRDCSGSSKHKA